MPAPKRPQRGRRKPKKNIPVGQAHIKTSFNNTIVSLTDREGNVIAWESAGSAGFKGSRKSTPFAAQVTADAAARKGMEHGLQKVEVFVKGPGSGRETAIRSLQAAGLEILGVKDVTRSGSGTAYNQGQSLRPTEPYTTRNVVLMNALDFAKGHPNPTEKEVRESLEGNLCRCTGYHNIVKSIMAGARAMGGKI